MRKIIFFLCAITIFSGVLVLFLDSTPTQSIFASSANASEDAFAFVQAHTVAQNHVAPRETIFHEVNVNIDVMENHSFYVKVSVFAEVFVPEEVFFCEYFPSREYTIFFLRISRENLVVTPIDAIGGNLRLGHNRDCHLRPFCTWLALENSIYDISPIAQKYSILYHVQFINYDTSDVNYFDWVLLRSRLGRFSDVQNFSATINMPAPFNHEEVEIFRNRLLINYYPANLEISFIENTIFLNSKEPIPARDEIAIRISLPDGYFVNVPTSQTIDTIRRLLFALILLPMFIAFMLAVLLRRKIITNPFAIKNANLILVSIGIIPLLQIFVITQVFDPLWYSALRAITYFPMIVGAGIMIHSIKGHRNFVLIIGCVIYLIGIIIKLSEIVRLDLSTMIFFMMLSASVSFILATYVKKITRESLSENHMETP